MLILGEALSGAAVRRKLHNWITLNMPYRADGAYQIVLYKNCDLMKVWTASGLSNEQLPRSKPRLHAFPRSVVFLFCLILLKSRSNNPMREFYDFRVYGLSGTYYIDLDIKHPVTEF